MIKRQYEDDIKNWFDELKEAGKKTKLQKRKTKVKKGQRPLRGMLRDWQRIYANYKGKQYKAKVLPSGSIKFNGKIYDTPTGAAMSIVDSRTRNGWTFWMYKDGKGNLVPLKNLRK